MKLPNGWKPVWYRRDGRDFTLGVSKRERLWRWTSWAYGEHTAGTARTLPAAIRAAERAYEKAKGAK